MVTVRSQRFDLKPYHQLFCWRLFKIIPCLKKIQPIRGLESRCVICFIQWADKKKLNSSMFAICQQGTVQLKITLFTVPNPKLPLQKPCKSKNVYFFLQVRTISNISRVWVSWSADLQASRLLLLNLVLDPFTYVLTRQQYRRALRHYLCCSGTRKATRSGSTLTVSSVRSSRSSSLMSNILYNVRRPEPCRTVETTESPIVFKKCKDVEAGVPSNDDKSITGLKYMKRFSLKKKVKKVLVV